MTTHASRTPAVLTRSAALALAATFALVGCRSDNKPGGGGTNPSPSPSPSIECPGTGTTVCALKNARSTRHPEPDAPVTLTNVVVTTQTIALSRFDGVVTLAGFYVQDPSGRDFLDGRYSGIAIVYKPETVVGRVPQIGTLITIEGTYREFGQNGVDKQKQIEAARIETSGQTADVAPIVVADPSTITNGGADALTYEGVLVSVAEVQVTNVDALTPNGEIFGAFRINADLIVSGLYFQYRNPQQGEQFSSIAGVLRLGTAPFDAGQLMLTPRTSSEVQPKNAVAVVRSISGLLDPSSPDRPQEFCENPNGQMVVGRCPVAELTRVLVVAADGYVSRNLRSFFVVDPTDQDGRYSGLKVVYNVNTFGEPPAVGTYVDVNGEFIRFRGGAQIQFPRVRRNGNDTAAVTPWVVPPSEITRTGAGSKAYEGTIVKLENVTVTQRCVEDDLQRDFGNWLVAGDTMIGSAFFYDYNGRVRPSSVMCLTPEQEPTGLCSCAANSRPMDQRRDNDRFSSIIGVVDYSFGAYTVNPRGDEDLVRAQ